MSFLQLCPLPVVLSWLGVGVSTGPLPECDGSGPLRGGRSGGLLWGGGA